MAFVGGLMGPYMQPIPVGASAAMVFSLVVAFIVTPWAAVRLLKSAPEAAKFTWRATCKWQNGTHSKTDVKTFFGI